MSESTAPKTKHPRGPRRKRTAALVGPPLFPLKTWCEQRNVPYTTIRDRAKAHEFPTIIIGKLTYVELSDMDRWIESLKERAEPQTAA